MPRPLRLLLGRQGQVAGLLGVVSGDTDVIVHALHGWSSTAFFNIKSPEAHPIP